MMTDDDTKLKYRYLIALSFVTYNLFCYLHKVPNKCLRFVFSQL